MSGSSIHHLPNSLSQYVATHDDGHHGGKHGKNNAFPHAPAQARSKQKKQTNTPQREPRVKLDIKSKLKRNLNAQTPVKIFDAYALLGVERNVSQREIHAAFRKKAMHWHPDRHSDVNKDIAHRNFKLINDAYDRLKTAQAREDHDLYLEGARLRQGQALRPSSSKRFPLSGSNDNDGRARLKSTAHFAMDALETIFWPLRSKDESDSQDNTHL